MDGTNEARTSPPHPLTFVISHLLFYDRRSLVDRSIQRRRCKIAREEAPVNSILIYDLRYVQEIQLLEIGGRGASEETAIHTTHGGEWIL